MTSATETMIVGQNGELMQTQEPVATEQSLAEESAKVGAAQTLDKINKLEEEKKQIEINLEKERKRIQKTVEAGYSSASAGSDLIVPGITNKTVSSYLQKENIKNKDKKIEPEEPQTMAQLVPMKSGKEQDDSALWDGVISSLSASPDPKLIRAAIAQYGIDGLNKAIRGMQELQDLTKQNVLNRYMDANGEFDWGAAQAAGQGIVKKAPVSSTALDQAKQRGAPQMAMPNIPDRDKQILAKVITGAIGNLGKAFVQGFGSADTAATGSIEVEPGLRVLGETGRMLLADAEKYREKVQQVEELNFQLKTKYEDKLDMMQADLDNRLDAAQSAYDQNVFNFALNTYNDAQKWMQTGIQLKMQKGQLEIAKDETRNRQEEANVQRKQTTAVFNAEMKYRAQAAKLNAKVKAMKDVMNMKLAKYASDQKRSQGYGNLDEKNMMMATQVLESLSPGLGGRLPIMLRAYNGVADNGTANGRSLALINSMFDEMKGRDISEQELITANSLKLAAMGVVLGGNNTNVKATEINNFLRDMKATPDLDSGGFIVSGADAKFIKENAYGGTKVTPVGDGQVLMVAGSQDSVNMANTFFINVSNNLGANAIRAMLLSKKNKALRLAASALTGQQVEE